MDADRLRKAIRLARVATQDNPSFSIVDAKHGYARSPTEEELLMAEAIKYLSENELGHKLFDELHKR